MTFWTAQILGLIGSLLAFTAVQTGSRRKIIGLQLVCCVLWVVQYVLLGAWTGVLINLLGLARGGYFAVDSDYFARYYADVASKAPELTAASGKAGALNAYKSTDNSRVILALSAIGRDAAKTFDRLARGETVGETESLWLAPEGYKPQLMAHIEAQIRLGAAGYIGIKVNAMNDADIMAQLVRASEAGTEVELFVRGICCLRPGVPGRTEHISVRSIIGRYLEHERIFVFGRGEAQEVFLGSGDLLERNTVRRIEAFAAVTDPNARAEVLEVLSAMRRDNRQAWIMQPDGSYLRPEGAGEPFVSQAYLHTYFAGRTIEKPAPPAPPQPRKKLPWWRRLWIWLKNN